MFTLVRFQRKPAVRTDYLGINIKTLDIIRDNY